MPCRPASHGGGGLTYSTPSVSNRCSQDARTLARLPRAVSVPYLEDTEGMSCAAGRGSAVPGVRKVKRLGSASRPGRRGGMERLLEVVTTSTDGAIWIDLRGEADTSTRQQLVAGLAAVATAAAGDGVDVVHLRLDRLEFCDMRSVCDLVTFTRDVRRGSREVVIHNAPPVVIRMIGLLGVQDEIGTET
jgi:hypothetical protein